MPIYDWLCGVCGNVDSIYIPIAEFDKRKDETISCPKCGEEMKRTFIVDGITCVMGSKQAYRPATCMECRNKVIMDAPYPKGCSKGKRCKGYMPIDMSRARKVTRKGYNQMLKSGKIHLKKGGR